MEIYIFSKKYFLSFCLINNRQLGKQVGGKYVGTRQVGSRKKEKLFRNACQSMWEKKSYIKTL